eukprot:1391204-Amorphochlora_amoeboformis.AAC.1
MSPSQSIRCELEAKHLVPPPKAEMCPRWSYSLDVVESIHARETFSGAPTDTTIPRLIHPIPAELGS